MIVANLATYPARRERVLPVAKALAPQVDRLNVVLNEYETNLPELEGFGNVRQILPEEDTKDVGKFFPDISEADTVFLVDDDVEYPPDYIETSLARRRAIGRDDVLCGYHGSLYRAPTHSLRKLFRYLLHRRRDIADFRKVFAFFKAEDEAVVVDQIATNSAFMEARHMPDYDYMRGSQRFVDVRLARWCFEKGIAPVCLPRAAGWLKAVRFEETIHDDFTRHNPENVAEEIWAYAFRVPGRGKKCSEAWS